MKKSIAILLLGIMVALCGCGGQEENKPEIPNVGENVGKVEVPAETTEEIPEETVQETEAPFVLTITPEGMDIISVGKAHVAGVRKDGTVVACGRNEDGECQVDEWTDVVKVRVVYGATFALRKDGTMLANGRALMEENRMSEVLEWTDIVDFDAKDGNIVGLKSDGTVVGIMNGGKPKYEGWTNVVKVAASGFTTLGIRDDGSVLYHGEKGGTYNEEMITAWTDMVDIDIHAKGVIGLQADGTVLTAYKNPIDTSSWTDVAAVCAGEHSVMAFSSSGVLYSSAVEPPAWENIIAIGSEDLFGVGVRSDGTVAILGMGKKGMEACENWTNIGIPE